MNKKYKKIVMILLIVIVLLGLTYIGICLYYNFKDKNDNKNILKKVDIKEIKEKEPDKTQRMLKLEELKKENDDIIGWLEINDTNINYPVLQGDDNDYYIDHNYKKEWSSAGSLFLDKDFDLQNGSDNYLIYGHRNKTGIMFEDLIKYANEDFYKNHTKIKFTTLDEDAEYVIISVFYSRVYYKNETNVFKYYNFVNATDENDYNNYVYNAKKKSIYIIDEDAKYGDQLLTLSTCEYSQTNGRFVVVAKKITDN